MITNRFAVRALGDAWMRSLGGYEPCKVEGQQLPTSLEPPM
ncbi:hypothetical protein ABIE44_001691 [Marmoricola sp. OAE513]